MSKSIEETKWWNDLMKGIYGPRKGGARIIVDAEDSATGAGKTGLAVTIARLLSRVFDYEMEREDLTLSGEHYLNRWREHPGADQPSVIILDELGGAGAGHARRAMSNQNVELGNAWQLMRKKRIVSIVTLPHWSKADKDMRQQADYRLWCRKEPIGHFQPYQVTSDFKDGGIKTKGYDDINRISFPNLDALNDPVYEALTEKKDELLDSNTLDADEIEGNEEEDKEDDGATLEEIADEVAENIDDYTSIHGGRNEEYVDSDLIEIKHDISGRDAKKVKKLVDNLEEVEI
jgi:hypothetical protein